MATLTIDQAMDLIEEAGKTDIDARRFWWLVDTCRMIVEGAQSMPIAAGWTKDAYAQVLDGSIETLMYPICAGLGTTEETVSELLPNMEALDRYKKERRI